MDFLDPKKKRAHTIRLFIGYVLVGIALLLAAVLLLFASLGYGIKRSTGELTQNGLLFVDAHPEAAQIKINGQERGQTDGRFVLESGRYSLELNRDGYRSWKRDFTLDGGNIVRLVYAFLFPVNLSSSPVAALTSRPDMVTQSPDRKWIVAHNPATFGSMLVIDTGTTESKQETVALPSSVIGGRSGQQSLEAVEWSTDNRHVLLKHTYTGGYSYVVFDRQEPEKSVNLNSELDTTFYEVSLRDKKPDQIYALEKQGGDLKQFSIQSGASEVVASNVQDFWPYKQNTVLYVTTHNAPKDKAFVKLKDGNLTYDIRELAAADAYMLNMAEFDGRLYVVTGSVADGKVYVYEDPVNDLKRDSDKDLIALLMFKVEGAQHVSFSANARFIAVQGGSSFAVYDAETEQQYRYDTGLKLAADQKARWMDGHRLMTVADGKMVVFDYDNANKQSLVAADAAYVPMFDRDYNQMFTISPGADNALSVLKTDLNLGKE